MAEEEEEAEALARAVAARRYEESGGLRLRSDSAYRHEVGWMVYRLCDAFREKNKNTFGLGGTIANRLRPMLTSFVLNLTRRRQVAAAEHLALVDGVIAYVAGKARR